MPTPFFLIDAFTDQPLRGNPAAVVFLEAPASAEWMQAFAAEMKQSETAFLAPRSDGGWDLRWFTPAVEVDLCGHATLASAAALWDAGRLQPGDEAVFHTKSGELRCRRGDGGIIAMEFPADPVKSVVVPMELETALGGQQPLFTGKGKFDFLVELSDEKSVRALRPDLSVVAALPCRLLIVTAQGKPEGGYDFVSRCFAPAAGIPEDPVTGSAHCTLACYWEKRLGKSRFTAYQASARGGVLQVERQGERILLAGNAVVVVRGEVEIEPDTL